MQNMFTAADKYVCSISNATCGFWGWRNPIIWWTECVYGIKTRILPPSCFSCFYLKYHVILSCFCTDAKPTVHLLWINLIFWFASKFRIKRKSNWSKYLTFFNHSMYCTIQYINHCFFLQKTLNNDWKLVIVTLFHWLSTSLKLHLYTVSWHSPEWLMWWKKLIMKAVSQSLQMIFTHRWRVSTVEKLHKETTAVDSVQIRLDQISEDGAQGST